jgi:hypothetical protein
MRSASIGFVSGDDSVSRNSADATPGKETPHRTTLPLSHPQRHTSAKPRSILSEMQSASIDDFSDGDGIAGGLTAPVTGVSSTQTNARTRQPDGNSSQLQVTAHASDSEDDDVLAQVILAIAHMYCCSYQPNNLRVLVFIHCFQLRMIEESIRLTPSPRTPTRDVFGSPAAAAAAATAAIAASAADSVSPASDPAASGAIDRHSSDDDDVIAVAALSNAAADDGASDHDDGSDSNESDSDSNSHAQVDAEAVSHISSSDEVDVQMLLLQVRNFVNPFFSPLISRHFATQDFSQGDVDAACAILKSRGDMWRVLHVYMIHDRFTQAASLQSSSHLPTTPPPPSLSSDLLSHASTALALDLHPLATYLCDLFNLVP